MIFEVLNEVRTGHLPDLSQKRYRLTQCGPFSSSSSVGRVSSGVDASDLCSGGPQFEFWRGTTYPDRGVCEFPHSLQAHGGVVPQKGLNHFLPDPF
jgi:hypothetical protein